VIRRWLDGVAGRLILPLLLALILVQVGLTVVLTDEPGDVAETLIHGQTLTSVVTLARLLADSPPDQLERLTAAFRSRQSCAWVTSHPSVIDDQPPSTAEVTLATTLGAMLHGVESGPPRVRIRPFVGADHPCRQAGRLNGPPPARVGEERPRPEIDSVVSVSLPIRDSWLELRTAVDVPDRWSGRVILSALISTLVTLVLIILLVRRQTRWLLHLVQAAETLGRGGDISQPNGQPPREVAAVLSAFDTMRGRLRRFMTDRIRLLAAISHDLRTPLTSLRLKAEFIDDDATRDGIVATIDEMTVITEAALSFTRAEAVDEPVDIVDLADLVRAAAEPLRLAGAAIAGPEDGALFYHCRPVAMKRAVRNLIENAVRYGERAALSLEAQPGFCVIIIQDAGPGMPAHQMEEAFQPFVRLETSRNAATGGLGLGLSIARGIIQAHGGTLTLSNAPTGGLRAEIRLPV